MQYPGADGTRGRAVLSAFLLREGMRDETVAHVLDRLDPFFGIADRGAYPFVPVVDDVPSFASAIADAAGCRVGSLRPVSIAALAALPTYGGRSRALGAAGANLRNGVWIGIWRREADALRAALGDDRKSALEAAFTDALVRPVRAAFDAACVGVLGHDLALHAWNTVEETAFYHLGLSLAGLPGAARLEPLLAVLPGAVPLCPARGDTDAWLVVTG